MIEVAYNVFDIWTLLFQDALAWVDTLTWLIALNGGGFITFLWWRSSGPSGHGPRLPRLFKRRNPLYNFKNKREPGPFKR